jgi:exodeoxyribonuclease III
VPALRVVTANVLFGGQDRFDRLVDLVGSWRPDLLVLQECLGWEDGERLRRMAGALGVSTTPHHAHLGLARPRGSGRRYHVAVLSRRPMTRVVDHADPAVIGHCLVEAELAASSDAGRGEGEALTVLGTHFDAHGEDQRLAEARYLRSLVSSRLPGELLLLAGDLNALSRHDPYPPDLAELVRRAGTDKYGHPPRFDVMDELEAAGWVDALRARPMTPEWVTARRDRGGVAIDYRTDYVLASPKLSQRLVGARLLSTDGASDHHAVEATFEL